MVKTESWGAAWHMLKHKLVLFLFILIAGCESRVSGLYSEGFPGTALWTVLPFVNFSQAEGVSIQVERMLVVQLASVGVEHPFMHQGISVDTPSRVEIAGRDLDDRGWANGRSAGFAVGGEIGDWFIDRDGYAQVSLSIYVTDASSGKTLWSMSSSKEGVAGEGIYEVCRALLVDILQYMPVNRSQ